MQPCDHKSVGVLITNPEQELLLIERARPPLFWAPPAGHIDDHGSELAAAVQEVWEEVGIRLAVDSLCCVLHRERMKNNQCRRSPDGWHDWTVYAAEVESKGVQTSPDEVKNHAWVPRAILAAMAYDKASPKKLEPVWTTILQDLGWIEPSNN